MKKISLKKIKKMCKAKKFIELREFFDKVEIYFVGQHIDVALTDFSNQGLSLKVTGCKFHKDSWKTSSWKTSIIHTEKGKIEITIFDRNKNDKNN